MEDKIRAALQQRREAGALRQLPANLEAVDFCSNDYLGLARSSVVRTAQLKALAEAPLLGATGSRLISGNSAELESFERYLATVHQAEAALLFNSGYAANQGLIGSLADRHTTILYDELVHASLREAIHHAPGARYSFRHNDPAHLQQRLQKCQGRTMVVVESVYSMDGDTAPLPALVELCQEHRAALVVDEAHAMGVFGQTGLGLVDALGLQDQIWARVYTFGKALGSHGAAVVGSNHLRDYLVNFARSFIYTTALPSHHYAGVRAAYAVLEEGTLQADLRGRIDLFLAALPASLRQRMVPSRSAIQCLIVPGNAAVRAWAAFLQQQGLAVWPILHPTVPRGQERLRICLHAFNTAEEIQRLVQALQMLATRQIFDQDL